MYFLGIHLGGSAALIRQKEGGIEWVKHFDVKRLDILQPLLEGKPYQLITGINTSSVLVRTFKLHLKSKREVLAALPFQIEGLLPTPIEELLLKTTIHKERCSSLRKDTNVKFIYTGGRTRQEPLSRRASSNKQPKDLHEVLLFAIKKSAFEQHLSVCSEKGLDPDGVSCIPLALWRFARYFFPKTENLLLFSFDQAENAVIAIEKERLKLSHAFFLDEAHCLERTIAFVKKKSPHITQAFLAGRSSDKILSLLRKHFELLELPAHAQEMGEHAVALGLAIDALVRDQDSLQLRQGAYISFKARQKRKRQLVSYWSACGLAFILALSGTQVLLKKTEQTILSALPEIQTTSIDEAVTLAENRLAKIKQNLLYPPHSPKLSDFLAWLSNHPIFSPQEGELVVEQLRYQLVPNTRKKAAPRPFIELQIRYSMPAIGRGFREALLADQTFIDQSKEVSFKGQHNRAQVTFYLKEKICAN